MFLQCRSVLCHCHPNCDPETERRQQRGEVNMSVETSSKLSLWGRCPVLALLRHVHHLVNTHQAMFRSMDLASVVEVQPVPISFTKEHAISVCKCIHVYIYIYMCVYIYIYIICICFCSLHCEYVNQNGLLEELLVHHDSRTSSLSRNVLSKNMGKQRK